MQATPRDDALSGDEETKRWAALARSLGLSPAQRQSLLSIRQRQCARLAELLDKRKELSMQARMRVASTSAEDFRFLEPCGCAVHDRLKLT